MLYAINGSASELYTVDPDLAADAADKIADIAPLVFGSVGVELHPDSGVIYACTDDTVLYSIDPDTGASTAIGAGMGHASTCDNLAAPWTVVPCLDEI